MDRPSFQVNDREIRALAANNNSYQMGVAYALNKKVSNLSFHEDENLITAVVTGTQDYNTALKFDSQGSLDGYYCSCPAFAKYPRACKHIVAVLKTVERRLSKQHQPDNTEAADFLALFTRSKTDSRQEELKLEVELLINTDKRGANALLQLRVGLNRLYVVRNLSEFLYAVNTGRPIPFGVKFTYDPFRQGFAEEDRLVLAMLEDMHCQHEAFSHSRYYGYSASPFNQKALTMSQYYLGKLLDALGDKAFFLQAGSSRTLTSGNSCLTRIKRSGLPLDFSLQAKSKDLALKLQSAMPLQLTESGDYYLLEQEIYQASPEQKVFLPNFIRSMAGKRSAVILFPARQKDIFASEALPLIHKVGSVAIEPQLAQNFIREKLQAKIYFDRLGENGITARLEFHYGNRVINPFSATDEAAALSKDQILIREMEQERNVLNILEQAEFTVFQGCINLQDEEKIFDFTLNWLPQLQELAETFYSDDFKLKIRSSTGFSGKLRLDESIDMLEISFAYNDIEQAELADLFRSLKMKKKYYRLSDGSFLDLKQPELELVCGLIDQLDLNSKNLQEGVLQLPKFRALYVDSYLRQANLPGIQRNKAFKQLVQSILDPQDGEFELPLHLQSILRDYQKTGFKWLKTLASYGLGGILADDMGLGKTLQVLAFILSEKSAARALPVLVVAPTSLVYNWQAETEKFTPELKTLVVEGTPQEREVLLAAPKEWDLIVISYAILRRDIERLTALDFAYCFLDEAQNIKNPQTINAKAVQRIQAKGYFALTGTPIENSLTELWSLFNFLMPHYLLSHQEFNKKYTVPVSKGDHKALAELSRHTKPFILRRLKKDVLKELPPKIETEMKASLTDEQRKLYLAYLQQTKSQIARELSVSGFAKSQIKILAALTRLRQICCHPAMFIDNYKGESGKMLLFQEVISEALDGGHRVLVFSQFTAMLDMIAQTLSSQKIETFYLSGSTPARERTQMAEAFNSGQGRVFLISLKAGGTGLNLTGADTVIHFDPWWNPAVEDQATDRAHRIGQNNPVQVIKLLTQGTIEEKVIALQARKKQLVDSVIQPGETMLSKLTETELKELFEIQ